MIRFIFSALVLIHGLLHFMGFSKAFGFGSIPIAKAISKPAGILWLVVVLLFAIVAQCMVMKKDWWHVGIAAVVLSELLIISAWSDAKIGTVINVVVVLLAVVNFMKWDFRLSARKEAGRLLRAGNVVAKSVMMEVPEQLPEVVRKWLNRSGAVRKPFPHTVRLKQKGHLRTQPDGRWMDMVAEQYFVTDQPSFLWLANIDYGITHIAGRDEYNSGKGSMTIKAASLLQVAKASGPETDQGTMLRYLAEIQWFPGAAVSKYIKWTAIDDHSALATMSYMGMSVSGTFFFNESGDITAFSALRYMKNNGKYSLETWFVPVDEYSLFDGIKVPSKGRAIWKLAAGDFNWFNWEVTDIAYNKPDVY